MPHLLVPLNVELLIGISSFALPTEHISHGEVNTRESPRADLAEVKTYETFGRVAHLTNTASPAIIRI
jgi:hypothetical protein